MTALPTETPATPQRSSFVSVLAWIGIFFCGFGSLIGLLQNIMIRTMFRDPTFGQVFTDSLASAPLPAQAKFMFGHMEQLVLVVFVVCLLGLAASIGLLNRQNWARIAFIGLLSVGLAWNLFGLFLQQKIFGAVSQPPFPPVDTPPAFAQIFQVMRIVMALLSIGFAGLFGWLIARLISAPVRAEFVPSEK